MSESLAVSAGTLRRPSAASQITVLVLFFVSGACGLIYEVLWARLLTLSFGVTVLAAATVIAAFMGGLALGSYLFGRWADRHGLGLRTFALLQVGIALYAVAFPALLRTAEALFAPFYSWQAPPAVFHLARFLVTFLLLLLPTTLMGGTLPVLLRVVCRRVEAVGWRVGLLYGTNTAGAVVGCALAGFWMAAALGTNLSIRLAAAGNVGVALAAWLLAHRSASPFSLARETVGPSSGPVPEADPPAGGEPRMYSSAIQRLVLVVAGVSGFCALSYEVLWFRILTVVALDYSAYSFAAMLCTFLAGLAVGSWVWGWLLRRLKRPVMLLGVIQASIGILGFLSVGYMVAVQKWYFERGLSWMWRQPALALMAVTALALFLPVTLMGGALPVASAVVTQRLRRLGRSIGTLYAANALGAIAGAFFPIFVLIPTVGTQWAVLITAGLNLTVGLLLLVSAPRARKRERVALAVGSLALAVLVLSLVPANSFRSIFERAVPSADRQLLYYRDGVTGTVTIHQSSTMDRILCINGLTEVPTDHASMKTFRVMGHVPMLLHPDPQRALSITFGGGIVAGAMAQHEPEVLDVVDVCEGVFDAARLFAEQNHHVLDYPGLRIFVNDARNFIAHAPDTYDVIISDCSHPKSGDSWVLFTREFYRDVHSRLSPDGVFAQFILIHRLTYPEFGALLGTLRSTFPHSTVWVAGPYVLVMATVQPFAIDYDRVRQGLQQPQVKASLAPFGMDDPAALLANLCLDGRGVESLTQGAPINTEDRPFVGLSHLWVSDTVPVTLQHIFSHLTPASTVLQHLPTEPEQARSVLSRIERFSLSHHHATWAEYAYGQRRLSEAIDHARTALQINPEDPDARYVLASAQADLENLARLARTQVQSFPNQASGYATLARVLAARGEPARAVDSLEEALALGLDTLSVREQLGNLYLGLGQAVGAARHFREALAHRPKSAALRVSLARALLAQGRREEAEQLLKDALGREPDNVAGHETLGALLLTRGEVAEAQEEFEAMLRSNPLLASPYIHLAHCYELRRLTPQALSNYRAALENDPYLLAAYLGLVRVLSQQGQWAAAGDWALRGLQFLPTSGELLLVLGDSALATGQLAGAEQAYRRALDMNPALTSAYAGLAQVASARGDRAQARNYWQEVLRRDPENRYARERLQELHAEPKSSDRPLPPG